MLKKTSREHTFLTVLLQKPLSSRKGEKIFRAMVTVPIMGLQTPFPNNLLLLAILRLLAPLLGNTGHAQVMENRKMH